jgi:hypothetical protein
MGSESRVHTERSLSGLSGIGYNYTSSPEKHYDYGPSLRHQT